jgi:hypothetical protein
VTRVGHVAIYVLSESSNPSTNCVVNRDNSDTSVDLARVRQGDNSDTQVSILLEFDRVTTLTQVSILLEFDRGVHILQFALV